MQILDIVSLPLFYLMRGVHLLTNNYLLITILLAIVAQIFFIPFDLLNRNSAAKLAAIMPYVAKIREKYPDCDTNPQNKKKVNAEVTKLYEKLNYTGGMGCLMMFVQLAFFMIIFYTISRPLSSLYGLNTEAIAAITERLTSVGILVDTNYGQLAILKELSLLDSATLVLVAPELANNIIPSMFIGPLDLSVQPVLWTWSMIIPILVILTTLITSIISHKKQSNNKTIEQAQILQKIMKILPIVMTGIIAFRVPSIIGLYWVARHIISPIYSLFIQKISKAEKRVAEYTKILEQKDAEIVAEENAEENAAEQLEKVSD